MEKEYIEFLKARITDLDISRLQTQIANRDVYIWGGDQKGEWMLEQLERAGIKICGMLDSTSKENSKLKEIKKPYEIIKNGNSKNIFIIVSMYLKHENEVIEYLTVNGFSSKDYFYPCKEWSFLHQDYDFPEEAWKKSLIQDGEKIIKNLSKDKFYFLLTGGHIGDEVLALSLISAFKEKHYLKNITVITSTRLGGIARLYKDDIEDIIVMGQEQLNALKYYSCSTMRREYNIIGANWKWMPKDRQVPFPIAQIIYKTMHLGLNYYTKSKYIKGYGFENPQVKQIIHDNRIVKDKSIILIPYAQSAAMLPFIFWEKLAEKLLDRYIVYTNVYGKEKAINGTLPLSVPLEYMIDLVNYAGNAISIRCGLTDVLALGECNCQVLYYIRDDIEENYSNVNKLYINGEESILYRNAFNIYMNSDDDDTIRKILKRL